MPPVNLLPWREELRLQRNRDFGVHCVIFALLMGGVWFAVHSAFIQQLKLQTERNEFIPMLVPGRRLGNVFEEFLYAPREEYEAHIEKGVVVYAGIDYGRILEQASQECDVLIWDGGNNDWPFYKPDLWIAVADPMRPGHETRFFPGEVGAAGQFSRSDMRGDFAVLPSRKVRWYTVLRPYQK